MTTLRKSFALLSFTVANEAANGDIGKLAALEENDRVAAANEVIAMFEKESVPMSDNFKRRLRGEA